MARNFTASEKKHLLAYRKATGKPVVGKYSEKQLPEYNEWAEANGKPIIELNTTLSAEDGDAAEQENGSGNSSGNEDDSQLQEEPESRKAFQNNTPSKSRKRGRPPKSTSKPSKTPKSQQAKVLQQVLCLSWAVLG